LINLLISDHKFWTWKARKSINSWKDEPSFH